MPRLDALWILGGSVRGGVGVGSGGLSDNVLSVAGTAEVSGLGLHLDSDVLELSLSPSLAVSGMTQANGSTAALGSVSLELAIAPRINESLPIIVRAAGGFSFGQRDIGPRISAQLEFPIGGANDITTNAALSVGYEFSDGNHFATLGLRAGFDLAVFRNISF